jgi:hypothetical protein
MFYAKVINGAVTYPYSLRQLQQDNPNTSFSPNTFSEPETLKDFNVFPVEFVSIPEYDAVYYKLVEGVPTNVNGVWTQNWSVLSCSTEEVAQNIETAKTNLQAAVQNRLDEFAQTRNYDGILSCCSYATSTVVKFQQEAQYAVQSRDAHWAACYTILQQFENGQRPIPTVSELLAEMPPLQWPN